MHACLCPAFFISYFAIEKFVGKIESQKLGEKKRIAKEILKYVRGSSDSEDKIIEKLCAYWKGKPIYLVLLPVPHLYCMHAAHILHR